MSDFEFVEVLQGADGQIFHQDIYNLVQKICSGDDKLKQNYYNFHLEQYQAFSIVLNKENRKIISFSGVQIKNDRWGEGVARLLSRFYILPEFRNNMNMFNQIDGMFALQFLKKQIKFAQNKNLDYVFLSRETNQRAFSKFIEYLNLHSDRKFTLLADKKNVCGSISRQANCFQYVAYASINDSDKKKFLWGVE